MTGRHGPVAAFIGGPLDGAHSAVPLHEGFLPDRFEPTGQSEGEYHLGRVVTHGDGSLCGGVYHWGVW